MTIEAMKQWREALKEYCEHGAIFMPLTALKSIDQAIADAEKQEPVALETVYETIIHWDEGGGKRSRRELARRIEALYTHPQPKRECDMGVMCIECPDAQPKREWVGLTVDEMAICIDEPAWDLVLRKAEQILKEKNT